MNKVLVDFQIAINNKKWKEAIFLSNDIINTNTFTTNIFYTNLGYAYYMNKRYDLADVYYNKAISLGGDNIVELYEMLAQNARDNKDLYSAYEYLVLSWKQLELESNKGTKSFQYALLNNLSYYSKEVGKIEEAIVWAQKAYNKSYNDKVAYKSYSNYLYMLVCSNVTWQKIQEANNMYNSIIHKKDIFKKKIVKNKKIINVGYLSSDFRQHVMFSFYYVLLCKYNKEKFKVTCYQLSDITDNFTEYLKKMVDEWENISDLSYYDTAVKIYEDDIDILIDLAGHTANNRLPALAFRPAPIQISGLGWIESTGLDCIDYFITDSIVDKPECSYLVEKPLYLESQFCYAARNDVPDISNAPVICKGYVTFGVFNGWHKVNNEMLLAWKKILDLVPNSKILFKGKLWSSNKAIQIEKVRLSELGFELNRLIFEEASNDYMKRYLDVDIALDTYPYTGGGTTCDALYMGVPVVSLYGKRRSSRFSYSILKNIGLEDLTAENYETYIEIAVSLAHDADLINQLHNNIRSMMKKSPVMNQRKYINKLEAEYIRIYNEAK